MGCSPFLEGNRATIFYTNNLKGLLLVISPDSRMSVTKSKNIDSIDVRTLLMKVRCFVDLQVPVKLLSL